MYDVAEDVTTNDIENFFSPIKPAKIAQNVGTDIYDVDFYCPQDAMISLRHNGNSIKGRQIRLEMLPGPLVPLPQNLNQPHQSNWQELSRRRKLSEEDKLKSNDSMKNEKPKILVKPFPDDPFEYKLKPYDPDIPEGQCAIQPINGYFCRVCRKFYKSRLAALTVHCKTENHYKNLVAYLANAKSVK